ncbi:hypothetical protein PSI23_15160 [Xenorhabdus sp. XENO-10]|uniref:Uncharacterized protein n=2 Tax=Xenorhabdus yunnanensis TaxID=3025878 RepID=A0ABT5LI00_9GAMM|nr:hypothetical protein [Xenorhabdus yunnanensis]
MYADRINILATESGVGVNLSDLRNIRGDITINVNGDVNLIREFNTDKLKSRNILAKTDLNIGAKITTDKGDLIVRTKSLESKVISKFDRLTKYDNDLAKDTAIDLAFSREGIHSWGNSYIYADILNSTNNITSKKDLILTGQELNHSYISGLYHKPNPYVKITPQIKAQNNLVIDFNKSVNINTKQFNDAYFRTDDQYAYRMNHINDDSISVEGKNVIVKANEINIHGAIKANNDLKFIANNNINAIKSELKAENEVSLIAGNNIDLRRLKLYAKSANLIGKDGNVKVYGISDEDSIVKTYTDLPYAIASFIGTLQDLIVSAGKNITFENTRLVGKTENIIFSANEDITIENNDKELRNYVMSPAHEQMSKQILGEPFELRSPILAKNLSMTAGKNLVLADVQINCWGGGGEQIIAVVIMI